MIRCLPYFSAALLWRCWLGLLLVLVAVFLLSAWALAAQPAAAQPQTLSGWFTFMVVDYPPESGLPAETTYYLTEDSGERHELLIDADLMRPLGGLVAVNRERVTVAGEWQSGGTVAPEQFRVHAIHLDPPEEESRPRAEGYQALQATSETAVISEAWVTILCRFADATDITPHPLSFYEKLTGSSYPGLAHYWNEVSYGNIDLAGSVAVGWYNLPRPRSYYLFVNEHGSERFETDRALADCTAAADADVFFPDFDGISLVFNHSPEFGVSQAGGGVLTKDGQTRPFSVTWIHPVARASQKTIAHEMGHTWRIHHSSGPYDETYDSEWDVMSGGGYPSDDGSLSLGVHTIAYHKDFLGWIPADRKYVARPNTTRTIPLERLARPGAAGYLMAEIPIGESDTDFYTVEARLFAGYDIGIPGEAVIIHTVDSMLTERKARVVDVDDNGDPNDAGAMWTLGETFTDLASGIQVSIDAEYATGFHVTIDYTICSEVLSPRQALGRRGGNASVRVRAPSGCSWVARSDSPWITVTGGKGSGDGRVTYTVEENPSLNARTGTLLVGGRTVTVVQAGVNGNLFEDDMESGENDWFGELTLTTASSRSGTHAWAGHGLLYSPRIDLTGVESATLTFWHRFNAGASGAVSVVTVNDWQHTRIQRFTETGAQGWTQASLDLSPFAGQVIRIVFHANRDEDGKDGWFIDDVVVSSSDFDTPAPTQATLENPSAGSFQSGIGIISGWACSATTIEIAFNDGPPQEAAYGTSRGDTQGTCGDTDNGFGLLFNWNLLGDGIHTVQALADGMEFARVTVIVTTLGNEFLRGASGAFSLSDFPAAGASHTLRWQEGQQNFVLTDGRPGRGGGTSGAPPHVLENPAPGSFQSGLGLISGWVCDAQTITISFDDGPSQEAAYGTSRGDTQGACGDTDNGFGLLFNWNLLGDGLHTVSAAADRVEFARVEVTVTTLGTEFQRELSREVTLSDFPEVGTDVALVWQEAQQNFVLTTALPTERLVEVNPVVTLPMGIQIPNVAVRSLYAETAEVLAQPEPSLLIAENSQGTVLLGVADMDGGVLGERGGSAEVSVASTAVVLVALRAGYPVHAIDQSLVAAIQAHSSYPALIAAMSVEIAADTNFLDRLPDYPDIMTHLQEVASAIAPSTQRAAAHSLPSRSPAEARVWPAVGNVVFQEQEAGIDMEDEVAEQKRRLAVSLFAASVADLFLPTAPLQRVLQLLMMQPTYPPAYTVCVAAEVRERTAQGGPPSLSPRELSELASGASLASTQLASGLAGALQDAEAALECLRPQSQPSSAALRPLLHHTAPGEDWWEENVPEAVLNNAGRLASASIGALAVGAIVGYALSCPVCGAITAAVIFSRANNAAEQAARAGVSLVPPRSGGYGATCRETFPERILAEECEQCLSQSLPQRPNSYCVMRDEWGEVISKGCYVAGTSPCETGN